MGHHVIGIANDDNVMNGDNLELLERYYPGTPGADTAGGTCALIDTSEARRLLRFFPVHSWRTARRPPDGRG